MDRAKTRRLIGYYHKYGYEIMDVDSSYAVYHAGNSPYDSAQVVDLSDAVPITELKQFCKDTGKEIAEEQGAEFLGVEQINLDY